MTVTLLSLPPEILIQILSHLPPTSLLSAQLTSSTIHTTVTTSTFLQYHLHLALTNTLDTGLASRLFLSERLERLRNADEQWAKLTPGWRKRVRVGHDPSGIYELTGGVYLLGDVGRKVLYYTELPSVREEMGWKKIEVDRTVVDLGLCIDEHDLVAVVTTHPTGHRHSIEITLLQFSTGLPYPNAPPTPIHVMKVRWEKPAVGIEIVGDHLVLVITFHNNPFRPEDRVFVWEWMTGVLKMTFTAPYRTYSSPLFLTPLLLLLPNTHTNALELWPIPAVSSTPSISSAPRPSVILALPELAEGRVVAGISCRGEPNPVGERRYLPSSPLSFPAEGGAETQNERQKRPFKPSPDDAIMIFHLRVVGGPPELGNAGLGGWNVGFGHTFTFFVHRRALVDVFTKFSTLSDSSGSRMSVSASAGDSERDQRTDEEDPDKLGPIPIPYKKWRGPRLTRWFNADNMPTRWITTTSGERAVLIATTLNMDLPGGNPNNNSDDNDDGEWEGGGGFPYVVLDFNEHRVGNMRRLLKRVEKRESHAEWGDMLSRSETDVDDGLGVGKLREEKRRQEAELSTRAWYVGGKGKGKGKERQRRGTRLSETHEDAQEEPDEDGARQTTVPDPQAYSQQEQDLFSDLLGELFDVHALPSLSSVWSTGADAEVPTIRTLDTTSAHASSTPPSLDNNEDSDQEMWETESDEDSDEDSDEESEDDSNSGPLEPRETWKDPRGVHSRLPYSACASRGRYAWDGVLMDEERVLGIGTDMLDRIQFVDVHHFG
ncbi:hypothetical protein B0H34DRAFT_677990 [Crassisporium funariophilum]|nr:hypothetical protein B0H34DRAFT_677990 [Crassisporium funariophilum]